MGGRRRFLKATLAALAALALLGGVGAGVWVASSDDDEAPAAIAEAPVPAEAAERPAPAEEPLPAERTEGERSPAPGASPPPPRSRAGAPQRTTFPREPKRRPDRRGKRFSVPPPHEFRGSGDALIGTVDVRRPAIVRWRARGRFGLEFGQQAFPIVAPSRSGELVVPPYRFELVRVLAKGRWTITVTPQR
jgi:hypothetical protein